MSGPATAWRRYWFDPAPLLDLAIARIAIVGAQLFVLVRSPRRDAFERFTALPNDLYDPLPVLHVLIAPLDWRFRPSLELLLTIEGVTIVAGAFALIGLFARPALVLFALGNIFVQAHQYSYGNFHHHTAPMMIALVVLALAPAGRILSVDDLRRRVRRSARSLRFEPASLLERTSAHAGWPLRLLQWVLALVYLSAAYSKLRYGGTEWMNGFTLQTYLVQDGLRWGSAAGLWLATQHELARILSWATVVFEATFVLAVIVPALRWIYLPTGTALHAGIQVTMRAPFFKWMSLYAVFVPWTRVLARLGPSWRRWAGEPVTVYYDGACPLCLRSVTVFDYLDWGGRLRPLDLADAATEQTGLRRTALEAQMHAVGSDGVVRRGFFAFRYIAARLPVLWPVALAAHLPGIDRLGPPAYAAVARARSRLLRCGDTCDAHVSG